MGVSAADRETPREPVQPKPRFNDSAVARNRPAARSAHPDLETEAWLSFLDRQLERQARVAGVEKEDPSPLEEAAGSILVAITNRMSGKVAELFEAFCDRLIQGLKAPGFKWPWSRKKPVEKTEIDPETGEVKNGSKVVAPG